jgi:antitoxin VapB
MALNIKDSETDRVARELAQLTGQSITTVVREALEDKLELVRARHASAPAHDLHDIIARGRVRPVLDDRRAGEIIGHDEHGVYG